MKPVDLSEHRKGRWTCKTLVGSSERGRLWECLCDCGKIRVISASEILSSVGSKSCGCLNAEKIKARTLHGHSLKRNGKSLQSPEYKAYYCMLARCYGKNLDCIRNYQNRGIIVCRRWRGKNGFLHFLSDMGLKPANGRYSLDRKNNDKNYHPKNCRWATWSQQMNNRRPFHLWNLKGTPGK